NLLSKESVRELARKVTKNAKASVKGFRKRVGLSEEKAYKAKWGAVERELLENVEIATMISSLKEIENDLTASFGKEALPFRLMALHLSAEEKFYANTDGSRIESRVPRVGLFAILTGIESGNVVQRFVQTGRSGGWEVFEEGRFRERVKEEASTVLKILKSAEKFQPGKFDVIVGPEVAGIMTHESVGHPGEADRILGREGAQAGESYLSSSDIGRQVGNENATIIDDPTIPGSSGYYLYDDEGVKAKKRVLISKGKINEFLHNRETAKELGLNSNAAARANQYSVEPIVRMANTYVEPGDMQFEEMVKEVKDGVIIKNFMEWNIDDKRFNQRYVGHEAYRIINGEIRGMVRNPILEVTTPRLWSSIAAKSRDLIFDSATCGKGDPSQGIPVWHGGPYMLLKDMHLGAR
ncbi:MAG: TldD/PmbA family protein, partial [Conexivisphaerales archaeon]